MIWKCETEFYTSSPPSRAKELCHLEGNTVSIRSKAESEIRLKLGAAEHAEASRNEQSHRCPRRITLSSDGHEAFFVHNGVHYNKLAVDP